MNARVAQRGFTLIEVIVAFGILALALTLLLGTLSGAAKQVHWSDQAGRAALHAQSLMAQTGVAQTLHAGQVIGQHERGRRDPDPEHRNHQRGDRDVPLHEHREMNQRVFGPRLAHHEGGNQ